MVSDLPPIGVFGHKRAAHLKSCLQAIERSESLLGQQLPIYIFCDGARGPNEEQAVAETVVVAKECKRAHVIVRERNFGFRNITDGITELCNQHERAIVIEDDVLIAPDFLPYMCAALKKYQADPRVFMATGFMFYGAHPQAPSTFFLRIPFVWGWATWKRAWDHFDWECVGWQDLIKDKRQCYLTDFFGAMPFSKGLRKTMEGQWNAWGPRWFYAMHKAGGVSLAPYRSMVWNSGCGGGTHGDVAFDANPELNQREVYIHGDMEEKDFHKARLPSDCIDRFPDQIQLDDRAHRHLALIFLQERLRKETRKRWQLRLKLLLQKILLPFTKRPS